jgi:filamentous hemagglutinin
MNYGIYRLIFNRERGAWMAAAEFVRGHGKGGRGRSRGSRAARRAALMLLASVAGVAGMPLDAIAAPRLPAGTVPVPVNGGGAGFVSSGAATYNAPVATATGKALRVYQASQKAVLNWNSFDVAAGSSVTFSHPSASAATLNKIGSASPSVIQGMINATARDTGGVGGTVYLINRNGILFDRGAQVNVGGLVASALDIQDSVFENGLLSVKQGTETAAGDPTFTWGGSAGEYQTSYVRVEAGADIRTAQEGRVMLLAPLVENRGSIQTPQGQTILAAGAKVYLAAPVSGSKLRGFLVEVDPFNDGINNLPGTVINQRLSAAELQGETGEINTALRANGVLGQADNNLTAEQLYARVGQIVAERGNVTLAALAVNQRGLVRATTSVDLNGSIYLQARDTVAPGVLETASDGTPIYNPLATRMGTLTFGAGSLTEVAPDLASTRTLRDDQTFNKSEIRGGGKTIVLEGATGAAPGAQLLARAGEVNLTAQGNLSGSSDFFGQVPDRDARIYLGKGSKIDVSGLRDVDLSVERNIIEAELRGNEFKDSPLQRDGILAGQKVLIDIRQGTPLADVSGYIAGVQRGIAEKSSAGGSIVLKSEGDVVAVRGSTLDVSGGSLNYRSGDTGTTRLVSGNQSFNIANASPNRIYTGFTKDTYRYEAGYVEGKNAGAVEINGNKVVLDGTLKGNTVAGLYQRELSKRPLGGRLAITGSSSAVRFSNGGAALPTGFAPGDLLGSTPLVLDSAIFNANGFNRLQLVTSGDVTLPGDVRIVAGAGGDLAITGRSIDAQGGLATPGGAISLETMADASSNNPAAFALRLGAGARLSTAGAWTSDLAAARTGNGVDPVVLNGGRISLKSAAELTLAAGSEVDVSGGAWQQATGRFKFGNAGKITLSSGEFGNSAGQRREARLVMGGTLKGYGLSDGQTAGKGGTLDFTASNVSIGGVAQGKAGELHLDEAFFRRGGFASYAITGRDEVTVAAGAQVRPLPESLVVSQTRSGARTSAVINTTWTGQVLPDILRRPGSLQLAALSREFGDVTIGSGASLGVDAGGAIGLTAGKSIYVNGTLEAPGGRIALNQPNPTLDDEYLAERAIWLGANSRLLARGYTRLEPNALGLRRGTVYSGGSVNINAAKGYLVTQAGSLIDVSGTQAMLDIPATDRSQAGTLVGSAGGEVTFAAREGMLLDGGLRAQGGSGALGGRLAVDFDKGAIPWVTFNPTLDAQLQSARRLVLAQNHDAGTAGLTFGQALDAATYSGLATLATGKVAAAGFAEVDLTSENRIEFKGPVSLSAQRSIRLDAPNLLAQNGASASLNAALVSLGNSFQVRQGASYRDDATTGTGRLTVTANHIDLVGTMTQQGFGSTTLNSRGDIDLRAVATNGTGGASAGPDYKGAFISAGDIALNADRIYPTSLSDFAVEIHNNPDGKITVGRFDSQAGDDGPVLSAGGRLVLAAPHVEQRGTLKAPFGSIELRSETITRVNDVETRAVKPGSTVTLADGSVTSVSGEGMTIPFGMTQLSGQDWVYALGAQGNRVVAIAPDKRILLDGDKVTKAANATIDLSGGGDMLAWEFLPGTGGSRDVLDQAVSPNTYAIVPGIKGQFAPYDLQAWNSASGLRAGDSIELLNAAGGLAAGTYMLLPARYALLPGAYTVTFTGQADARADQVTALPEGGWQVAAYRSTATLDGMARSARSEFVEVAAGDVARTRSEYIETLASQHFAGGRSRLPGDAGQLAIRAGNELTLNGTLNTSHAAAHRGAEVDIAANKLALVGDALLGDAGAYAGFMKLGAGNLNRLGAESLSLGGIRERDATGTTLVVSASDVVVDNAGTALVAPDLIIAATDKVTVEQNAELQARGASAAAEDLQVAGDGALLRLSSNGLGGLVRSGVTRSQGMLDVKTGATLTAAAVTLDATRDNSFAGTFGKDAKGRDVVTALGLGANRISLGAVPAGIEGLALNDSRLAELGRIDTLRLKSYSSLDIYGAANFGTQLKTLDIQAGGIAGRGNAGKTVTLEADNIAISNPDGIDFDAVKPTGTGSGTLKLAAADTLTLGTGTFKVDGFDAATLRAGREIVAAGKGSHDYAGNLTLEAGRITAQSGARQKIMASGALVTAAAIAQATPFTRADFGGQLSLAGATLDHGGRIDLPSGKAVLQATAGDLNLLAGSGINAGGATQTFVDKTVFVSGGEVVLESSGGDVIQDEASSIDVSGASDSFGNGGNAGRLNVFARSGKATLAGALDGHAGSRQARGGEFILDGGRVADFSALATRLGASGFNERVDVRARNGDMALAADKTLRAANVRLATDDGNLAIAGTIDASGAKGGTIELYANRGATAGSGQLALSGQLKARATEVMAVASGTRGEGGSVTLGVSASNAADADQARLLMLAGSSIDVSAAAGSAASGGSVLLRAPRVGADEVAISGAADGSLTGPIGTTITGAASVVAEPLRIYETSGNLGITTTQQNTWKTHTDAFMASAAAIKTRLGWSDALSHIRPGIEARATGDITLANDWNLWTWRNGGEPGLLTLRAGGNVNLNASLSDGFINLTSTTVGNQESWSYRIAAGADTGAANPLALQTVAQLGTKGNVNLAAGKLVRTGTGSIDIAAGGNITAGSSTSAIYTAGLAGTSIPTAEFASINNVNNPSFPMRGGDLRLLAQGDIAFQRGSQAIVDWLYRQGGLQANGTLGNASGSVFNTAWWINFPQFKQGIGALGGGDVTVNAGGDIRGLSVSAPTNARLKGATGTLPTAANLVTQGGGDVTVTAGGDITDGMFYAAAGAMNLKSGGSFGTATGQNALALGDSRIRVEAGTGAQVSRVVDPFLLTQATGNITGSGITGNLRRNSFFSNYTADSSVDLMALSGDMALGLGTLLPPTLNLAALGGSVNLVGGTFTLAPAPLGNLNLLAADAIVFDDSAVALSDAPVSALARPLSPKPNASDAIADVAQRHSSPPLHAGDPEPVRIVALKGNISGRDTANSAYLPKKAIIQAGGDIINFGIVGQNLDKDDVTRITAGGNILFTADRNSDGNLINNSKGIELGGPGYLQVVAGGDVDLGSSTGIVTRGNFNNPFLADTGANVFVQAGAAAADYAGFLAWLERPEQVGVRSLIGYASLGSEAARAAFLRQAGSDRALNDMFYAILRGVGRAAATTSGEQNYQGGYDAIAALFPEKFGPYKGDIKMFFSQVKTEQGGGIDLMAPGGLINAGLAVSSGLSKGPSQLGIVTARGGNVRAFAHGDFAVNQSRVFTLQGGDILIWSSEGDIDAGKGSKTAAATPPPQIIVRGDQIILDTSNSVAGSGIGVLLGKDGIAAGSVDLIAPKGTVIAGEAGIRALGDIFIPGKVSGADNIQAGGNKVGSIEVDAGGAVAAPPVVAANDKNAQSLENFSAPGASQLNSILIVEVLGMGDGSDNAEGSDDCSATDEQCQQQKQQKKTL